MSEIVVTILFIHVFIWMNFDFLVKPHDCFCDLSSIKEFTRRDRKKLHLH